MERSKVASDPTNQRRPLRFEELSQVVPEAMRLKSGHRTVSRWTLAQICKHLANSFNGSIDGLDLSRHKFKRFFLARQMLRYTFRYGIPVNYTVDPNIEPTSDVDLDEALEQLAGAIERYQAHGGLLRAHPLFGEMPRDDWNRIHRIHCAHHLSFVLPTPE